MVTDPPHALSGAEAFTSKSYDAVHTRDWTSADIIPAAQVAR